MIYLAENSFCTDGGLLANGEPIGASGLRQIYELTNQLRGPAAATSSRRDVSSAPVDG